MKNEDVYRFWSKVKVGRQDQCWPWVGSELNNQGYGRFCVQRSNQRVRILAHRLAYELHTGQSLEQQNLLHRCDNPPCCNPHHLRPGSQQDNIADMRAKGRNVNPPTGLGEANPYARLTEAHVREIRALSAQGLPATAIAPRFQCSPDNVRRIVRRERWAHIA